MANPTKGPLHYEPKFVFDEDAKSYMMQGPSAQTVAHDMQLAFARDVEGKLRAALIEMGWAPPDEAKRLRSDLALLGPVCTPIKIGDPLTRTMVDADDLKRVRNALVGIIDHWREFGSMIVLNNATNRDDYGMDERVEAAAKLIG